MRKEQVTRWILVLGLVSAALWRLPSQTNEALAGPVVLVSSLVGNDPARWRTARVDRSAVATELAYGTFFGGSSADSGDDIVLDADGNTYVAGKTNSADFPVLDAMQPVIAGDYDAFVAKFDPAGALVLCTFIGGSGEDLASSVAVDSMGNIYVAGHTKSNDFPTLNAMQPAFGGGEQTGDGFVAKLNAEGTAFIYSTYVGGSEADRVEAMAVDVHGSAYLTGSTGGAGFPTRDAWQTHFGGGASDAFATKLGPEGLLLYSTYLGGSSEDSGHDIAVNELIHAYIAGSTFSSDFPVANSLQASSASPENSDATVVELDPTGGELLFATYFGGSGYDRAVALAVDGSDNIYVAGITSSSVFPQGVEFPSPSAFQSNYAGIGEGDQPSQGGDAFLWVINRNQQGASVAYGTFLGGSDSDYAAALALDRECSIYLTGHTESHDFPLADALQANLGGERAAFVARAKQCEPGSLEFTPLTYYGGSSSDKGKGIAVSSPGEILVTGSTESADLLMTDDAYDATHNGQSDAFVVRLLAPEAVPTVTPTPPAVWRLILPVVLKAGGM
jgi:hypothetical protein